MTSDTIALISTLDQARHFLKQDGNNTNIRVVAFHESVRDFFQHAGINCAGAAEYVTHDELNTMYNISFDVVDAILTNMDACVGKELGSLTGIEAFDYFQWRHTYSGVLRFFNGLKLDGLLNALRSECPVSRLILYKSPEVALFERQLLRFTVEADWNLEIRDDPPRARETSRLMKSVSRLARDPGIVKKPLRLWVDRLAARRGRFQAGKPRLLIFDPAYEWEYLLRAFAEKYRIVIRRETFCSAETRPISDLIASLHQKLSGDVADDLPGMDDLVRTGLARDVKAGWKSEFLANGASSVRSAMELRDMHDEKPFSLALAGLPPRASYEAISINYIRALGVPLMAMQHGSGDAVQYFGPGKHYSKLLSCDYYATYGGQESDWQEIYPAHPPQPRLLPVGSPSIEKRSVFLRRARHRIDLFFPLANILHFLEEGFRPQPDLLRVRQHAILDWLERQEDLSILIKPYPFSTDRDCCVMRRLRLLEEQSAHIQVLRNTSMERFQAHYAPRAVVIEYASTPLWEMVIEDAEIFLMLCPVTKFGRTPLAILKRRAHVCDTIETLTDAMNRWKKGDLPRLRDPGFLETYVRPHGAAERLLKEVNRIVEHKEGAE